MFHRHSRSAVVFFTVVTLVPLHAVTLSPTSADAFSQKIDSIRDRADRIGQPGLQRTSLTEDEFNSWFLYRGDRWRRVLPSGVAQPQVTMVGEGRVTAQAVVDLDAVKKRRSSGGLFDPLNLVGGTVPVAVTGVLHTRDGLGRFEVQSAEISGIPVPAMVLQELVGYYSRTPEHPQGIRLEEPFDLPASITRVEIGRGLAVVVQ